MASFFNFNFRLNRLTISIICDNSSYMHIILQILKEQCTIINGKLCLVSPQNYSNIITTDCYIKLPYYTTTPSMQIYLHCDLNVAGKIS